MSCLRFIYLVPLLIVTSYSHASSIYIGLNSNNLGLATNINYASLEISDNGGDIEFTMTLNDAFFNEGANFGVQKFYFNSILDLTLTTTTLNGHPGWSLDADFGTDPGDGFLASVYGRYNLEYQGNGTPSVDPLNFTIMNGGDSLMNYVLENDTGFAFAANITGFNNAGNTSGWFASDMSLIPLPAAVWLFGTALIGFLGFARRKSA